MDLLERIHHNQPLEALSKMSFAIIQAVIRKLERRYGQSILDDVNKTMKLIRYGSTATTSRSRRDRSSANARR